MSRSEALIRATKPTSEYYVFFIQTATLPNHSSENAIYITNSSFSLGYFTRCPSYDSRSSRTECKERTVHRELLDAVRLSKTQTYRALCYLLCGAIQGKIKKQPNFLDIKGNLALFITM